MSSECDGSSVESTVESTVKSTVESTVESTAESTVESTIESTIESTVEPTTADPSTPQLYCYIRLQTLRSAPFNLPFRQTVIAKARARNKFGIGEYSTPNKIGA